jgi:hypothetical protein
MATPKEHLEALLRLSPAEREFAANALWDSLDDDLRLADDPEADDPEVVRRAWAEEIVRRVNANEPGIPAERVYAEIDAELAENDGASRKGRG